MVDQHHRHAFTDVSSSQFAENTATCAIQTQIDNCFFHLVKTRLRIVDVVTGQFNLFVNQQGFRMIATTGQQFETARNIAFQSFAHFDRVVFHHAYFQSRGTANDVFCFGSILYTRQLYDDAVEA